jgi:hypothetical protein
MKETDESEIYGNEYGHKLNNNKVAIITVDDMTTASGDWVREREKVVVVKMKGDRRESEVEDMANDRGEDGDGGGEDEEVLRERPIVVTISGDGRQR